MIAILHETLSFCSPDKSWPPFSTFRIALSFRALPDLFLATKYLHTHPCPV